VGNRKVWGTSGEPFTYCLPAKLLSAARSQQGRLPMPLFGGTSRAAAHCGTLESKQCTLAGWISQQAGCVTGGFSGPARGRRSHACFATRLGGGSDGGDTHG